MLRFRLAITEDNKDAWTDLLRKPTSLRRDASFTVGLQGKERFDTVYRFNNKILKLTIVAWTLVLGIIFVSSFYEGLQMPEFSTTLLGLMGISAGTYVSLKFPEK